MSFYRQVADDRFESTEFTRGPWDARSQHAGPPAALLGRAIEQRPDARADMRVARITYDIGRPVPVAPLTVTTRVVRSGRSVEVVEAELAPDGAAPVMRAAALRIRTESDAAPTIRAVPTLPGPDSAEVRPFFPVSYEDGYHTGMEFRFVAGEFLVPGPATCWFRMRMPLVDDEPPSPLVRVLAAADSGNGISAALDWRTNLFINPDLTVHLYRYPEGEWVCLSARTSVDPAGIGMADTALLDQRGAIGRAAQSLFVAKR
jgi:acyl-Coa thioesterase superfamily protein/acyl-CoA thioesterase superfamily protein